MKKIIGSFIEKCLMMLGTIFFIVLFGQSNSSKATCNYELMGEESFFGCSMARATFYDQSDFPFYREASGFYSDDMVALYNKTERYPVYSDEQRSVLSDDGLYSEMMSSGFGIGGYQVNHDMLGYANGYFMHYSGELTSYIIRIWSGVCDGRNEFSNDCEQRVLGSILITNDSDYFRTDRYGNLHYRDFLYQLDKQTYTQTGIKSHMSNAFHVSYITSGNRRLLNTITIQETDGELPIRMSFLEGVFHPNPLMDPSFNNYFDEIDYKVYDKYKTRYVRNSLELSNSYNTIMIGLTKENMSSLKFEFIELTDDMFGSDPNYAYESAFMNLIMAPNVRWKGLTEISSPGVIALNNRWVEDAADELGLDLNWEQLGEEILAAPFLRYLPDSSLIGQYVEEEKYLAAYLFAVSEILSVGRMGTNVYDFDPNLIGAMLEGAGRVIYNMGNVIEQVIEWWDIGHITVDDVTPRLHDEYIYLMDVDTRATCFFRGPDLSELHFIPLNKKDFSNEGAYYSLAADNYFSAPTLPEFTVGGESTVWAKSRTITITMEIPADLNPKIDTIVLASRNTYTESDNVITINYNFSSITDTLQVRGEGFNYAFVTFNVYVDIDKPTLSLTGESTSWTKANRTITLNGADAVSGVAYYSCDGGTTWNSSTASTYTCTFSTTTTTAVVGVKDAAGNYETKTANVYVDKKNPTVSVTKTFSSAYVDLVNSKIYIPFTPGDANSGFYSATSTNGGTYSSNKLWFPISSISNKALVFKYTVSDKAGNSISETITIDVTLTFDDTLKGKLKSGVTSTLNTNVVLTPLNNGNQLGYTIDDDAATVIANLEPFGINPNSENINLRYVFVSNELNSDLTTYNNISRKTSLSVLQATLKTPLGQKEKPGKVVSLVLIFEDLYVCVGTGTIAPTGAVALASTFDTYASTETTYQGAGLGEDGTVVSFSDDANSTMAVTLGASNMIEKRDVYGNLEWEKVITSSGKIELKKVINNEYGILVLGETTSGSINGTSHPFMGGKDILVMRLDKQGNSFFTSVLGTAGTDMVVAGDMNDNRIALLVRNEECTIMYTMNADGTNLNFSVIAGTGIYPSSIAIKNDRIVVIGSIHSEAMAVNEDGINNPKSSYVQLYENGSLVWTRTLGGSLDVSYYSLGLDDSSIYVVGQSQSTTLYDNMGSTKIIDNFGGTDSMIVKYDYDGNITQISALGGDGNDKFNQILVTTDKVIVAGISSSNDVTASHYLNSNFHINKIAITDTLIITLNKNLIIEEGLNLSYEEGMELQEIGINQYTEQLMILSSKGVHTQKVVDDTFKYEVVYEDGVLKIKANEKIASAIVYDGTNYYEIGDGIELPYGAYEVKVTSITGQSYTQVVGFEKVVEHSILPMIGLFASILTLGVLVVLVIRKYRKKYISA